MEKVIKMIFKSERQEETDLNQGVIIEEIRDICKQLRCTELWFQMEDDSDLIDACIYKREELLARYRYLIRKAKNDNLCSLPFTEKAL